MPTKSSTPKSEVTPSESPKYHLIQHYYSELARLSTTLFVGVFALMAFLLVVGLSHPSKTFQYFLYATIIVLPLTLLAYAVGQGISQMAGPGASDNKTSLKVTRAIQQILFILGLIVITGLALSTAHFFFATAASQSQTQSQSQAAPTQ